MTGNEPWNGDRSHERRAKFCRPSSGRASLLHSLLVERAVRWLRNTVKCRAVISQMASAAYETPDVIGWRDGTSWLVECKTNRRDFLDDKRKQHRWSPEYGMGKRRVYLTPPGLLQPEQLPANWGLAEVCGGS